MESIVGKVLGDLATLVTEKWFAAMGLIGLVTLMWVMLAGTPQDDILVGAIAVFMIGVGFGEAECRTFQEMITPTYKITKPVRRMNTPGRVLYFIALIGAMVAAIRAITLIW